MTILQEVVIAPQDHDARDVGSERIDRLDDPVDQLRGVIVLRVGQVAQDRRQLHRLTLFRGFFVRNVSRAHSMMASASASLSSPGSYPSFFIAAIIASL